MLDPVILREASSKAWWKLKKEYPFYKAEVKNGVTTLKLLGDNYKFIFDDVRRMAWVESKHHYIRSNNFKLCTAHRTWQGIFSLPRFVAMEEMQIHFKAAFYADKKIVDISGPENAKQLGIEAKKVYCSVFRGDKDKMSRRFGPVIWSHLNKDIGKMTMKVLGLSAGSIDYTIFSHNTKEIIDTLDKAPGILPIWRDMALLKLWDSSEQSKVEKRERKKRIAETCLDIDEKLGLDTESPFYISENFKYSEIDNFEFPNIIKTVREHLMSKGLTNEGWRYLIKLKPCYAFRMKFGMDVKGFILFINWMAKVGVVPRYTMIKEFMRTIGKVDHTMTPSITAMVRCGLREAEKVKGVRRFFDNQFSLVLDWFERGGLPRPEGVNPFRVWRLGGQVQLDANQMKAPWSWFMRQQQDWHVAQQQQQRATIKQQVWKSELQELKLRGYEVVPLTSSYDLFDEGKDMHHCVGSYANSCVSGDSRIFSLRKSGVKVATLEIRKRRDLVAHPGNMEDKLKNLLNLWEVNQVRGHCNSEVPTTVKNLSKEIAKRYGKACVDGFNSQELEAV